MIILSLKVVKTENNICETTEQNIWCLQEELQNFCMLRTSKRFALTIKFVWKAPDVETQDILIIFVFLL